MVIKFDVSQVSIVIASVGRGSLNRVISNIDSWPSSPMIIIVSLPNNGRIDLGFSPTTPVCFFRASSRGQVLQRVEAFRRVTSRFVLQLDDDISIDYASLIKLGETLLLDKAFAVGTKIRYENQKDEVSNQHSPYRTLMKRLEHRIIGSNSKNYFPGKDTLSGVPILVDSDNFPFELLEVDYVSGGAMLHYRKNLILQNYFPFEGRADYEDLFHCLALRKSGVRIVFRMTEGVIHEQILNPFRQSLSNIFGRAYTILGRYNELSGRRNVRLFFWASFLGASFVVTSLITLLIRSRVWLRRKV
jgi:GT2 family glycosyltransferase